MPLSWSALHAQLLRQANTLTFELACREIWYRRSHDLPPGGIAALMAVLRDPAVDPDAKNRALGALIVEARGEAAETAIILLLLSLWPGLDAVYGRLARFYPGRTDVLVAELSGRLTLEIGRLDLDRVRRFAATLLRNVERDLRRDLQRNLREAPGPGAVECFLEDFSTKPMFGTAVARPVPDLAAHRERLSGIVGGDAHLVLLVTIGGCSQRQAAERLGISHDAARKRIQRAMARLGEFHDRCPDPDG